MRLKEFLQLNKIKGEIFAKHAGITHRTLMYALSGKDVKLDTAMKIEKATCGAVTCYDMHLDKNNDHTNNANNKQQQQNQACSDAPV
jgi:hypothetical protein